MNKILIILLLFCWAGCTQQREEVWEKDVDGTTMPYSTELDTLKIIYTFVVGADHIMRQINPEPSPPCLYSTEYEVCQMRGHDYIRQNVYKPDEITCKWCWSAP